MNFVSCLLFASVAISFSVCGQASRLSDYLSANKFDDDQMAHNWAVLVAGSNGWYNYRHQADISHAYQILKSHGFHEDKIIVMMYDDVANNDMNPYKGKLFNNYSHIDVYEGVKIDYRGEDVTPKNFIKMMKGDAELKAKGFKVLESTAEDKVFFNFADHGAYNLIAFPNDNVLYANQLKEVIEFLEKNKRFKEMLIYIEACYSGSMFEYTLPENVYATTAANDQQSSWACYCEDPSGLENCLGDTYSINWMHDSDYNAHDTRTIMQQYAYVKLATNKSDVQKFGLPRMAKEDISEFQGLDPEQVSTHEFVNLRIKSPEHQVDSLKAHLVPHYRALKDSQRSPHARKHALNQINLHDLHEKHIDSTMDWLIQSSLVSVAHDSKLDKELEAYAHAKHSFKYDEAKSLCYSEASSAFFKQCYSIQKFPILANYIYKLRNLCEMGKTLDLSTQDLVALIEQACDN